MKKLKILVTLGLSACVFAAVGCFSACNKNGLNTPTELIVDEDDYLLTWSEVEDARSYVLEIVNTATSEVKNITSNREYSSLKGLETGDYEIRIKAIGREKGAESDWSETLEFNRPYETGCVYTLINNVEYEVTRAGTASGDIVIEDYYKGKPVTSIAKSAFKGSRVTGVVIGNNVKTIGENAFHNSRMLTSITIPDSVTSIGKSAFQNCISLTSIDIPDSVTTIEEKTFINCSSLKTIDFGKVSTIGDSAFSSCTSLTSLVLPETVTTVGPYAFAGNESLASVKIGSKVRTIGLFAFNMCTALKELEFAKNSSLTSIGQLAFQKAPLTSIVLPEGVVHVGAQAFYQCEKLATISLPESLMQLGAYAFAETPLYKAQIEDKKQLITIDGWIVNIHDDVRSSVAAISSTDLNLDGELVIKLNNDVVGIADQALLQCANLKQVILPASVRAIGEYAFYANTSLWKVQTAKVKYIGEYAFQYCGVLSSLILGEGLETIDSYAFQDCVSLNNNALGSSIIPDSVKKIGAYAFYNTKLWANPDEHGIVYAGNWVVGTVGVSGSVTLKDGTVGIGDYAFVDCSGLEMVSGLGKVSKIGRGAFSGCFGLKTVTISQNLTYIDEYTFYNCASLFSFEFTGRSKLVSIGRSAFYGCEYLNTIDLSRTSVQVIDNYAFYNCYNVKEVDFGDNLVSIGDYAFYKCSSLETLDCPENLLTIGNRAFYKNTNLKTLHLNDNLLLIGEHAFSGCGALEAISIPSSVKLISNYAFYKCIGVQEVALADGIEYIGHYAFYGLDSVSSLHVPVTVKSVGNYAFKGWNGLTSLTLSKEIDYVGSHSFYGCKQATIYTDATSEVNWSNRWNSSFRPVVWGCTLSLDNAYVVSLEVTENTFSNQMANDGLFTAPEREGYTFLGWATVENGEVVYSAEKVVEASAGTILYAVWEEIQQAPENDA